LTKFDGFEPRVRDGFGVSSRSGHSMSGPSVPAC
jgi:hypothetical protein